MALEIRPIALAEYELASQVALNSFTHLAAQYQSAQGVATFAEVASPAQMRARDAAGGATWVAIIQSTIIGLIQVRADAHITLLFILPEFQSRGVGRALIKAADAQQRLETVHASPNSVMAYMRYGFMPIGAEQLSETGIRFVPMKRN
ncbi:GNAT family N-acetyltransferase [Chitinibacter bivalviorum]|uniref:GNAT family N-acetyltransferase n=1 Tax=Chitinibacter bivalviorum TaxID=2739434 RepID=A0A7H9BEM1_9NEIS|nr:GNAT family N-acetyltransferase [Chitinibacter bivalviorum]QLG87180.1 GNAT family N-acetyltransferase [Chitinibacter bivalviorum]